MNKKTRAKKALLIGTAFIILLVLVVSLVILYKIKTTLEQEIYHTSKGEIKSITPRDYGLSYTNIRFHTYKGLMIKGWYIEGKTKDCILLAPGKGSNRWDVLQYAPFLHQAGYSVLLFDPQGTGLSQGQKYGFGYFESRDLIKAIDYLKSSHQTEDIGILGRSAGATAAILASLDDPRIKAIVADSAFANLKKASASYKRYGQDLIFQILFPIYTVCAKMMLGVDVNAQTDLTNKIQDLNKPILFIHGRKDKVIHPSNSELLYSLAPEPKEIWLVSGADHVQAYSQKPNLYRQKTLSFFEQHL